MSGMFSGARAPSGPDPIHNPPARYDSRVDTLMHKKRVLELLMEVVEELQHRAVIHDNSKLESPEREGFDEWSPKLAGLEYGSAEYFAALEGMKPFLDGHYASNPHHPQFHERGIHGMSLIDIVEMLVDWKASTERMDDGDLGRSIERNRERFGYGDEIVDLLLNTAREMAWCPNE